MTKGIVLARTKGIFQFVSSPKHNNDRDMYMDEALNPQRSSVQANAWEQEQGFYVHGFSLLRGSWGTLLEEDG